MEQVYVLNRLKQGKMADFIHGVFGASGVKFFWRNYAEATRNKESTAQAEKEIRDSDSLFLILDPGIMEDSQAREWFRWASGCAQGRDVWVLQDYPDLEKIMVPLYGFKHHVIYCQMPAWAGYLAQVIRDRHSLATASPLLAGVRSGALEGGLEGFFDRDTGLPLTDGSNSRPVRFFTSCQLYKTPYILHMPEDMKVTRCLDCHRFYALQSTRPPLPLPVRA